MCCFTFPGDGDGGGGGGGGDSICESKHITFCIDNRLSSSCLPDRRQICTKWYGPDERRLTMEWNR